MRSAIALVETMVVGFVAAQLCWLLSQLLTWTVFGYFLVSGWAAWVSAAWFVGVALLVAWIFGMSGYIYGGVKRPAPAVGVCVVGLILGAAAGALVRGLLGGGAAASAVVMAALVEGCLAFILAARSQIRSRGM